MALGWLALVVVAVCLLVPLARGDAGFNQWVLAQEDLRRESPGMASVGNNQLAMFSGISNAGVVDGLFARTGWDEAWVPVDTALSPSPRSRSSLCSAGVGRAVLFGGISRNGTALGDCWLLTADRDADGDADGAWAWAWSELGPQRASTEVAWPEPRAGHDMAAVETNTNTTDHEGAAARTGVVMFGGRLGGQAVTDETWVLWPDSGEWERVWPSTPNASWPAARDDLQLQPFTPGRAVLFGGRTARPGSTAISYLDDTWIFDLGARVWRQALAPRSPPPRCAHAFSRLNDTTAVLFGGYARTDYLSDTWVFDFATEAWTEFGTGPQRPAKCRQCKLAVLAGSPGIAVLFSGFDGADFLDQAWAFATDEAQREHPSLAVGWTDVRSTRLPSARSLHAMVPDGHTRALLFGGVRAVEDTGGFQKLDDTWLLQPTGNTSDGLTRWRQLAVTGPSARTGHDMALVSPGLALLFGGKGAASGHLNDTWLFDFDGRAWEQAPAQAGHGPAARDNHALASLLGVGVVLFGGYTLNGAVGDVWRFVDSERRWAEVECEAPPSRWGHQMAHIAGKVVMFGGRLAQDSLSQDTWVLEAHGTAANALTWTELVQGPSAAKEYPLPRAGHAMASVGWNKVAMFGGVGAAGYLNDLWVLEVRWDGDWVWQLRTASRLAPPARSFAAAASLQSSTLVVQGGMIYDFAFEFNDGWLVELGCPRGSFMNGTQFWNATCDLCPVGSYSDRDDRATACVSCPTRYTTSGPGATSVAQCNKCDPALCSDQGCGFRAGAFVCICSPGFFGKSCESRCPGEAEEPCGQGTCSDTAEGSGECTCDFMYAPASLSGNCEWPFTGMVIGLVGGIAVVAGVVALGRRYHMRVNADMRYYRALLSTSREEVAKKETQVVELQRSWRLRAEDLEFEELVGRGGFAEVWRGKWAPLQQDVAIKKMFPLPIHGPEGPPMFDDAEVDCLLRTRGHPRLVLFFGVGYVQEREVNALFVVTEFMPGGSLQDIIAKAHSGEREFTWPQRLQCARDVAEGMAYLHSLGFLHRDLKSPNVLSDGKGRFKLADFGLARRSCSVHDAAPSGADGSSRRRWSYRFPSDAGSLQQYLLHDVVLTSREGSVEWMAPELIADAGQDNAPTYSHKVDVYAFGVVLWELLVCSVQPPWAHLKSCSEIQAAVTAGQRPQVTEAQRQLAPSGYCRLMELCWHQDPDKRPPFSIIVTLLEGMANLAP